MQNDEIKLRVMDGQIGTPTNRPPDIKLIVVCKQLKTDVAKSKYKCHKRCKKMSQMENTNVTNSKYKCHKSQIQMSQIIYRNVTNSKHICTKF